MIAYTDNLLPTCTSTPASISNIRVAITDLYNPFNLIYYQVHYKQQCPGERRKFHPVLVVEGWGFKEQMVSYAMSILIVSYRGEDDKIIAVN